MTDTLQLSEDFRTLRPSLIPPSNTNRYAEKPLRVFHSFCGEINLRRLPQK
ncbi:hypothetical protein LJC00_04155 [Dysgonomonas sp. OttesenSCG-928-M03]|nr:hypothetical protein [Dysgonomonas sp. OttesenSCG-928-M03]